MPGGRRTNDQCAFKLATVNTWSKKSYQWYGPEDEFHKVQADDGNIHVLKHHVAADEWTV